MKILLFIFLIFFTVTAFGAPCGGALAFAHKNPDGSIGGFVAKTASVAASVTVDSSSTVCEKSIVQGNAKIVKGSEISGKAIIEGSAFINSSKVKDNAKVYGNAVVTNSTVCQMSSINFNVNNSNYYCDLEDDNPKDPGEIGTKTLLGVDSNANGIRDDVEIWINNFTTNTPNKNMYNVRMALRQIAKNVQQNVKMKDNRNKSIEIGRNIMNDFRCLEDLTTPEVYEELSGDLQIELYNTMERLNVWAKLQGNLSGQSFKVEDVKKRSTCAFKLK